jgi:hypothetical protein
MTAVDINVLRCGEHQCAGSPDLLRAGLGHMIVTTKPNLPFWEGTQTNIDKYTLDQ